MSELLPDFPVTLDKPRLLRLDHRMVRRTELALTRLWAEPRTFYSAMAGLVQAVATGEPGKISVNDLAVLLWQGCLRDDPALTLETVEDALPVFAPVDLIPFVVTLLDAWQAVSPPPPAAPVAEDVARDDPLAASTGSATGALPDYASV